MSTSIRTFERGAALRGFAVAVVAAGLLAAAGPGRPADASSAGAGTPKTAPRAEPRSFTSPDDLFRALADAATRNDAPRIVALLGPGGDGLVHSGDAIMDRERAQRFAAAYRDKHSLDVSGNVATLIVGQDDWPFPVPAVKGPVGWSLDAKAGIVEVLARRVGQNELDVIEIVRAIVDAQHEYAAESHGSDGLRTYASRFRSTAGQRDGLYWPTKDGEPPSPLGLRAAEAADRAERAGTMPTAFHGYHFRILTAQGPAAKGGARDYRVKGRLLGGFAVLAYPARYGNSGIMTFIAGDDGVVYQKDLGRNTTAAARAINAYDPDRTWTQIR